MSDAMPYEVIIDGVRLRMEEEIERFRKKLELPTRTWRDVQRAAHDRAFVVAGAMKADLLRDLHDAVTDALGGESLDKFRERFLEAADKHNWRGWAGSGSRAGRSWRTRVVYQTNMATSYATGRRRQLMDLAENGGRTYWRYVHSGANEPRPQHKMWGDMRLTLPYNHPFWQTHYPPNGWGCGCSVYAVEAPAEGDATEPPEWWKAKNPRTGAPIGLDEGWDYAPGASTDTTLRELVQNKLVKYPPALAAALSADIRKGLNATLSVEDFVKVALGDPQFVEEKWLGFVDESLSRSLNEQLSRTLNKAGKKVWRHLDMDGYLVLLPATQARHVELEHGADTDGHRPPQPSDYTRLFELLETGELKASDETGPNGERRFIASKAYGKDTLQAVFEVRHGRRNRALSLYTLYVHARKK